MTGQYSHKQFFRRMPNTQLAEYFKTKSIGLELDFNELKEKDTEKIFNAFLKLPEKQQTTVEADFQNVNALANEGGVQALIDESIFLDDGFIESISAIDGFHDFCSLASMFMINRIMVSFCLGSDSATKSVSAASPVSLMTVSPVSLNKRLLR